MNETLPPPLAGERFGNLLLELVAGSAGASPISQHASRVSHDSSLQWSASAFTEAAAWLMCAAHAHASQAPINGVVLPDLSYHLLGFRGQAAKYDSLSPTLFRNPRGDERHWTRVASIFMNIVRVWTDQYCQRQPGGTDYRMEAYARLAMPQHYGVRTMFLDWSFDPIAALFFAIDGRLVGEGARVVIRHFAGVDDPGNSFHVLLPHPCLSRPWRQCGFFEQCLDPLALDDPILKLAGSDWVTAKLAPPSRHWNIVFPVDHAAVEWARSLRERMYADEYGFAQLARLSERFAHEFDERTDLYDDWEHVARRCGDLGAPIPTPFTSVQHIALPVSLSYREVLRYLDAACAALNPDGEISYFAPALQAVLVGTPRALFEHAVGEAGAHGDHRSRAVSEARRSDGRWPSSANPRRFSKLYHPVGDACDA